MWSPGGHVRGLHNTFLVANTMHYYLSKKAEWNEWMQERAGGRWWLVTGDWRQRVQQLKEEASCPWRAGRVAANGWLSLSGIPDAWRETGGLKHVNVRATETQADIEIALFLFDDSRDPKRAYLSSLSVITDGDDPRYLPLTPLSQIKTTLNQHYSHISLSQLQAKQWLAQVLSNVAHQIIQW